MGLNVRQAKLNDSTAEILTSLSKSRSTVLTNRKQTALDTDSVNEKLSKTVVEYIKETNKGNEFHLFVDIEDKKTIFRLCLANGVHLSRTVNTNIFALPPTSMINNINSTVDYLKTLRKTMEFDAVTKTKFILETGDETKVPLVVLNIKTRTKYF